MRSSWAGMRFSWTGGGAARAGRAPLGRRGDPVAEGGDPNGGRAAPNAERAIPIEGRAVPATHRLVPTSAGAILSANGALPRAAGSFPQPAARPAGRGWSRLFGWDDGAGPGSDRSTADAVRPAAGEWPTAEDAGPSMGDAPPSAWPAMLSFGALRRQAFHPPRRRLPRSPRSEVRPRNDLAAGTPLAHGSPGLPNPGRKR